MSNFLSLISTLLWNIVKRDPLVKNYRKGNCGGSWSPLSWRDEVKVCIFIELYIYIIFLQRYTLMLIIITYILVALFPLEPFLLSRGIFHYLFFIYSSDFSFSGMRISSKQWINRVRVFFSRYFSDLTFPVSVSCYCLAFMTAVVFQLSAQHSICQFDPFIRWLCFRCGFSGLLLSDSS